MCPVVSIDSKIAHLPIGDLLIEEQQSVGIEQELVITMREIQLERKAI